MLKLKVRILCYGFKFFKFDLKVENFVWDRFDFNF